MSRNKAFYIFIFLVVLNLVLLSLTAAKARGLLIPSQPDPVIKDGVVDLDALTLQQKIAQMTLGLGSSSNRESFKKMQLGGIYLFSMQSEDVFTEIVDEFQKGMEIPFMISVDLEGCFNPFANFKQFEPVSNIDSIGEAFEKGKEEGEFMSRIGVTLDFAPVVDLEDTIWNCRSFPGDADQISELANAYLLGLQDEGISGTAKHYPGKTLVIKDPHKFIAAAEIGSEDLLPYRNLIEKGNIKAIMVSHIIVTGELDSEGKPSVVSEKLISSLRQDFDGLIITDEIMMLGLRDFYPTLEEMYVDVFLAGSDVILNFNNDPNEIHNMILTIEQAVEDGLIDEDRIDASVRRILEFKGFEVR